MSQPTGQLVEMLKGSPTVQEHLNTFAVPTRSVEDGPVVLAATFALSWGATEIARLYGGKKAVEVLLDTLEFALKNSPRPGDAPIQQMKVSEFQRIITTISNP